MTIKGGIARLDVLGVQVSPVNIPIAMIEIDRWVREGYRSYASLTGGHGIMELVPNEEIRRAHNGGGLVLPDGMPLVWLLWRVGFSLTDPVIGSDLMLAFFQRMLSYSGAFPASSARWQERLQNVRLPSHNEVPLPNSQYDAVRAVTQDLS